MLAWGFSFMSQASMSAYSWTGSLTETNIRALYERCQRLRLTGLMQLHQGDSKLELMWVGGEPIENEGDSGTRTLPLWNNGAFVVEQRMPDWKGQLTTGVEMSGSLRSGQIQAIYKLCADNVLSADVDLLRGSGEAAQLRFTLGKAESAAINGQTESALSAISTLSGWADGTFRVVLRPLFGDATAAEAPVFKDKNKGDDQFDVTGSINIDVSKGPVDWPAGLRDLPGMGSSSSVGKSLPPKTGLVAEKSGAVAVAAASTKSAPAVNLPGTSPLAATAITPPKPAGLPLPAPGAAATVPMSTLSRAQIAKDAQRASSVQVSSSSGNGKTIAIISILFIVICAGVIGILFFLRHQ
jgi:hypothetical protein